MIRGIPDPVEIFYQKAFPSQARPELRMKISKDRAIGARADLTLK